MKNNPSIQKRGILHVINKSSTRYRMDFGKTTGHENNIFIDFMGNICKYVILKHAKWNTLTRATTGLILETICSCIEVIFWNICHSMIKHFITLISSYFRPSANGNILWIYIEELDLYLFLNHQPGFDVNLDMIGWQVEVQ